MKRLLTGIAGALGVAALLRSLRRRQASPPDLPAADPAEELRAKLAQARDTPDDREAFDAAEGVPVDEVEAPSPAAQLPETRSIDERRRAIHAKAEEALGLMRDDTTDARDD